MSRVPVIISTARTGLAKSFRGGFNATHGATLGGFAVKNAVERAKIDPKEVEDVIFGCGLPENATGYNIARQIAVAGGCPVSTGGVTVSRFCASGLQAIADAALRVKANNENILVAGGVESISIVQPIMAKNTVPDKGLLKVAPAIWMSMIETADIVAHRYKITRERQDDFAFESQMRTARAQEKNLFADEIVPMQTQMQTRDEAMKVKLVDYTVTKDECNRADTKRDGLSKLKPVRGEGYYITAGNASQFSDGASAVVIMEQKDAERRGLKPLGAFLGFSSAGCNPDEMGIGPVFAIPKLLQRHGLKVDDIGIWELNEAFASQSVYCMDKLNIDPARVNVNGGAISVGHPYGMSGARIAGHLLLEGRRRKVKYGVATMCVAQGQGCAGLFEIFS